MPELAGANATKPRQWRKEMLPRPRKPVRQHGVTHQLRFADAEQGEE